MTTAGNYNQFQDGRQLIPHRLIAVYVLPSKHGHDRLCWVSQKCAQKRSAQFIAVCRRSKWSKHLTNSPLLALLAIAGSNAAYKISSACSNAFR
jgi:hypothetical protein